MLSPNLVPRSSAQPHCEKPEAYSDGYRCCGGHGVWKPIAFPDHAAIVADSSAAVENSRALDANLDPLR